MAEDVAEAETEAAAEAAAETEAATSVSASASASSAASRSAAVPLAVELRSPTTLEELERARSELEGLGEEVTAAMALPDDPLLWAAALTGKSGADLQAKSANEGA